MSVVGKGASGAAAPGGRVPGAERLIFLPPTNFKLLNQINGNSINNFDFSRFHNFC